MLQVVERKKPPVGNKNKSAHGQLTAYPVNNPIQGISFKSIAGVYFKTQRYSLGIGQQAQHNLGAVRTHFFTVPKLAQLAQIGTGAFNTQSSQVIQNHVNINIEQIFSI